MKRMFHLFVLAVVGTAVVACEGEDAETPAPPVSAADRGTNPENADALSEKLLPEDEEPEQRGQQVGSEATAKEDSIPYVNPVSAEEAQEGWISLFDGHTLFGWESANDEVNWRVEDGAIVADSGPVGLLVTTVPFADYELRCTFEMEAEGNSGLFLRTVPDPQDVTTDCYELNIADTHPDGYTTGSLVGRKQTDEPLIGSGGEHTFRVVAEERKFTVWLDDEQVLEYTDESDNWRKVGLIGLQHNQGRIAFREILLKPLQMQPMLTGEDLSGWRVVPGSKSEFDVDHEVGSPVIHVKNGPGFLETEDTYADFIFQADAIVHGQELNSGYFFRAMPGTEEAPSNGYEVQIHNGYEGERTNPNNAGTGAIFRRVEARRVIPNDGEWFTTTLVAAGPDIAVWVNGYRVVSWTDTREPDENPRRGLRTKAGRISLQGHDPTTDLSFRNLKISRLE